MPEPSLLASALYVLAEAGASGDVDEIIGGILAWVFVGLLIAGIAALVHFARRDPPASGRRRRAAPGRGLRHVADDRGPAQSEAGDDGLGYEFVQRRRDEDVCFAILRAVGATADVYRNHLRLFLERQDGPDWLNALNGRRRADMLAKGLGPPAAYASFEPRAVLNCLAYDPAGLQLVDFAAVDAARKLCGLANAAHHPDPDKPLTASDYQRAWQLYTQITGYAAPFDPYGP